MHLPQQPVYAIVPREGPSIESDRLIIRPVQDSDAQALFAVRSLPEVAKMNWPKEPFKSIEETRAWMATKTFTEGPADVLGCSFNYAIVDKSGTGPQRVVGSLSINQVHPYPEIGYAVHPDSWGKGVATEALQLMLKMWWDLPRRNLDESDVQSTGVEKAFALCEKVNVGSCRVLEKCGFKIIGEYRYDVDELFVFALEKP
ncbi:N-acetyltransferase GNAT family [Penicillium brevicompactum]|uniref:N-acetyltransferase GNAT family n=1 Tax=Penicillium brevicompactum TaxID=5074 RepID=A0A9W9RJX7_PENBR|nr:N-acetyltransferase GNAT family [Penicillium brevicompactum]